MRHWKVILLVNVALALGFGGGVLWWAREVRSVREELAASRREAEALRARAPRSWSARGIVRFMVPQMGAVYITHETIPGLMEGMTMGFEAEDTKILDGLTPGDPVRFTLAQKGERLVLVAIEKERR
jgi:Cu/Ag efflux protein CusF